MAEPAAGGAEPHSQPLGLDPWLLGARTDTGNSLIAFAKEQQIPYSCIRAEPGAMGRGWRGGIAGVLTAPLSLPRGLGCWPGKGGAFPRPEAPTPPQESRPLSVPRTEPSCGTVRVRSQEGPGGAALLTSWGWREGAGEGEGSLSSGRWVSPSGAGGDTQRPLPCTPTLPWGGSGKHRQTAGGKGWPSEGRLLRDAALRKHASISLPGHCWGYGRSTRNQDAAIPPFRPAPCFLSLRVQVDI